MRLNSSLNGVRDGIHSLMSHRLQVVHKPGPENSDKHDILKVAKLIFGIDGDTKCLWYWRNGFRKETPFLKDIELLCSRMEYDWNKKQWHYFAWTHEEVADAVRRRQRMCLERPSFDDVVVNATVLLQNVLIGRAWPIAALSRWTHVVEGLKKIVFGAALGNVLIDSLAALAATMQIDEQDIQQKLQQAAAAEAKGDESGGKDLWAKHCARVFRVVRFWCDANRPWQAGVVLVCVATIDSLTSQLLGRNRKSAKLQDMADPELSIIARTSSRLLGLLQRWGDDSPWALLKYLGDSGSSG